MAKPTFTPIVFNEGAPLDPAQLNNLQTNITALYQDSSLKDSSADGISALVRGGQVSFGNMVAGERKRVPLNLPAIFADLAAPFVVATFRNQLGKDHIVSVSVDSIAKSQSGGAGITLVTNKAINNALVDWIAVSYQ